MKKSDIIADALGTLDEKTLTVPNAPEEERSPHILPRILAFGAFMLALVISLPFLRAHFAQAPADDPGKQTESSSDTEKNKNGSELVFTTEGQPASEPGWVFVTDKTIDAEAVTYFPDLQDDSCIITGHNAAVFSAASMLDNYQNRLSDQGFTRLQCGDENLFYCSGVLIREQRCQNPETHKNDSFCVNVYIHHQAAGGVSADEAVGIINENCLTEMIKQRGDNNKIVEVEYKHDPVPFAVDITPSGFFGLTGMQIFLCPWTLPNWYETPYAVAFLVNANGAVKTDMGCDQRSNLLLSAWYNDVETCFSKDGYFGAPVLCDMNSDGNREMILLTPYDTYAKSQVYLTVYGTDTPAVLAKSKQLTFKAEHQELLYAEGGHAVLHSWSDDEKIDEYYEVRIEYGQIALYDAYGKQIDLNLLPEVPLDTDIQSEEPYKFTVIDEDDEFVKEELVDEKTSLTQDDMIDRLIFTYPLIFDVDGKKWLAGSEYAKNIVLYEDKDGEFKKVGGYKFRYNSLAMLYMANRSDGRNVYASSGYESADIYRYDLLTGDVYTFIKTKCASSSPYYVNGMLLYVSIKNNVYTLKAAVLSENKIYRICSISSGDHPSVMLTDNGAFAVIGTTVYFMGLNGKTEKIAELPGTVTFCRADGEKLYVWDRDNDTLTVVDRYGNTVSCKYDGEGVAWVNYNEEISRKIITFRGALVSLVKKPGGGVGIYLDILDTGKREDISPETDVKSISFSACVCGDDLYVFALSKEEKLYLFKYSPDEQKLILCKTF